MQTIPLRPVPNQATRVVLAGQNCEIIVSQQPAGIFVDVAVSGVFLVDSVVARDAVPLVCREYAGFVGNLYFIDTQGSSDPQYSGLGSRFQLVYLTADEYVLIR